MRRRSRAVVTIPAEQLDALERLIAFLREWDSEDNNADSDLLEALLDTLRSEGA